MKYCYKHERPALAVDIVVFRFDLTAPQILLVKRGSDPFKGNWALPGGFLDMNEELETSAKRELSEECGLDNIELCQLEAFGSINRDPRGRTISIAYLGVLTDYDNEICAGSDASDVGWHALDELPPLAFDHNKIIESAKKRLNQGKG